MKQFPVLAVLSSEKRTRRSNATQSNTSYNNIARSRLSLRTAKKSIVYCNGEFLNECCSPISRVFPTGFEFILRVANGPIPLSLSFSKLSMLFLALRPLCKLRIYCFAAKDCHFLLRQTASFSWNACIFFLITSTKLVTKVFLSVAPLILFHVCPPYSLLLISNECGILVLKG